MSVVSLVSRYLPKFVKRTIKEKINFKLTKIMNTTNIVVAVRNRRLLNDEIDSHPPLVVEGHNVVEVKGHRFTYDYVFGKDSSNLEVYEEVVKNKIPNLFEGFNVTILAYGSTGSGKTYTMGTDYDDKIPIDQVGIIPQGIDDIFKMIESEKDDKEFVVKVSYVEIYNEEIYDLGIPKGKFQDQKNKLQICEREDKGAKELTIVEVRNLTQKVVHNTKQALQFLMKGSGRRHIGETAKNKFSSRSHAILNVLVQQTDKSTGSGKSAKFQLVDLAGSERSNTSQTSGIRLKEGTQINKSLFQLSSVIMALTSSKQSFINYRSSKLTHLLRDSLGGNTYTVMIACVNPSSTSAEETLSTLRYAHTARKIKNQPKVNMDTAAEQLKQLQKEVSMDLIAIIHYLI
ncbi:hypothetical protein JTE90_011008 [Oedothorax gibbosus]|uniref:Kinesin-like protein n=1 Tax=Oedothorax gibbosus TaxID=931172 RepID=A0AAV6VCP6_9ARAC|nr:hypothetical protein JTE90_011008 [Oedothorax gibbosus]